MISVIICTYNRERMFEETIRSFLECRTDTIEHELLLVDNNSTDKTREVGLGFAARYLWIRYIYEPVQGLTHARNRGIRESRGEIVSFLDDDVYFSPGWMEAIASSFERHPDVACIGGKIVPHFEGERPSWLEDDLLDVYSVASYGDHEREIHPPEYPIGCNMAFRRSVFEQLGGFPSSLGRKAGNLLSNDETYFLLCLVNAELKLFYSPDAQVSHRISSDRTTHHWLFRRWYWQGISDVAMRQIGEDPLPRTILAKRAFKTLYSLLRQWRNTAGTLSAKSWRDGIVPLRKQIEIWRQFGTLRQTINEMLTLPEKKKITKSALS
jgi:glycosyltransferase involved in cell wall biosynthesis